MLLPSTSVYNPYSHFARTFSKTSNYGGDSAKAPGTFAGRWTRTNVEPTTLTQLSTVKIKDIPDASDVILPTGWLVSINSSTFIAGPTTMDNLDTIAIQITSGTYDATVSGNVIINSTNCPASITTRPEADYWLDTDNNQILDVDGNPIEVIS